MKSGLKRAVNSGDNYDRTTAVPRFGSRKDRNGAKGCYEYIPALFGRVFFRFLNQYCPIKFFVRVRPPKSGVKKMRGEGVKEKQMR